MIPGTRPLLPQRSEPDAECVTGPEQAGPRPSALPGQAHAGLPTARAFTEQLQCLRGVTDRHTLPCGHGPATEGVHATGQVLPDTRRRAEARGRTSVSSSLPRSLSSFLLPTQTTGCHVASTSATTVPSEPPRHTVLVVAASGVGAARVGTVGTLWGRMRLSPSGRWAPSCVPARKLPGLYPRVKVLRALYSVYVFTPKTKKKIMRGAQRPAGPYL